MIKLMKCDQCRVEMQNKRMEVLTALSDSNSYAKRMLTTPKSVYRCRNILALTQIYVEMLQWNGQQAKISRAR